MRFLALGRMAKGGCTTGIDHKAEWRDRGERWRRGILAG